MFDADTHGLAATFAWDSADVPLGFDALVRITGRRVGVAGPAHANDQFVTEEWVRDVVPNSGPVTVTAQVRDINPGEWTVTAQLMATAGPDGVAGPKKSASKSGRRSRWQRLERAGWSWRRWAVVRSAATPINTRWAPTTGLDAAPAVLPGSYVGLIAAGIAVGLVTQARMLAGTGVNYGHVLLASLVAVVVGVLGAKLWYLADRASRQRESVASGWCIQGFLAGAALALAVTVWAYQLPIGIVIDATTPGLFLGLAIGRWGCFFTGCCAGRPSAGRWAVWSSDRRVGARRVPTQPLESIAAAAIAAASWFLFREAPGVGRGALLVGAFGMYTLCRQVLLRLRAKPRRSSIRGGLTAAASGVAVLTSVALLLG